MSTGHAQEVAEFPHDSVFLYNGDDHDSIVLYLRELKRRGLNPWMASQNGHPGNNWEEEVSDALKRAPAVVVFFGPQGLGPWQEEELHLLQEERIHRAVQVVPVALPGGHVPKNTLFALKTVISCRSSELDLAAADKLEQAISGIDPRIRRGRYEILCEVLDTEPACFVATSHATSAEIYEVMVEAAKTVGLTVRQPREVSSEPQNVYSPDIVVAIRSARVIIADGTIDPKTGKPDADVMYEVGLAAALAKPIVFVTTPSEHPLPLPVFDCGVNCSRVEYQADELNVAGPLQERLVNELTAAVKSARPPHLIKENELGISVVYSELFHLCPVFWPRFEQIIRFGLVTKTRFAEILKYIYKLQQVIDIAHADATNVHNGTDAQPTIDRFRTAYQQFCEPHQTHVEQRLVNDPVKAEAAAAFEFLLEHTAPFAEAEPAVHQIIQRSCRYFQILDSYLGIYLDAHDAVLNRIRNPEPLILRQLIQLHTDIQQLARTAELVPVHACEMMFEFLKLIGMRDQQGGN